MIVNAKNHLIEMYGAKRQINYVDVGRATFGVGGALTIYVLTLFGSIGCVPAGSCARWLVRPLLRGPCSRFFVHLHGTTRHGGGTVPRDLCLKIYICPRTLPRPPFRTLRSPPPLRLATLIFHLPCNTAGAACT